MLLYCCSFGNCIKENGKRLSAWIAFYFREGVQISTSGHADADQSGPDSVSIGTYWNGIGNRSNFFIRPITDVIDSWLISASVYQRLVIISQATLLTKIMLGNVYVNKSEGWMIVFSMYKQAGQDQLFIAILYLVFLKCALFQKKKGKKRATNTFIEDFLLKTIPGNNKELLCQNVPWRNVQWIIQQRWRQKSISKRSRAGCISDTILNPTRVIEESLLEEF